MTGARVAPAVLGALAGASGLLRDAGHTQIEQLRPWPLIAGRPLPGAAAR